MRTGWNYKALRSRPTARCGAVVAAVSAATNGGHAGDTPATTETYESENSSWRQNVDPEEVALAVHSGDDKIRSLIGADRRARIRTHFDVKSF